MGGEGHTFEMVTRFRQNREMLKSRRERVRQIREMYLAHYRIQTSKPEAIKEKIRRELHQRQRRAIFITGGIIIVLIAGFLYWILNYHPFKTFTETFLR